MLKMLGLSSAFQFIIQGIAIAVGMAMAGINFQQLAELLGMHGRAKRKG
jgi:hypothetical protein